MALEFYTIRLTFVQLTRGRTTTTFLIMSLIEWLFESQNPGSAGSIEQQNKKPNSLPPPTLVVIFFLIAICFLGIPLYMVHFPYHFAERWGLYLGILAGEIIYLILGFFVKAQPDTSNVGWLGGLIDNPFRISDDFNRFLFFLKIILLPGRLISVAIINFLALIEESQD